MAKLQSKLIGEHDVETGSVIFNSSFSDLIVGDDEDEGLIDDKPNLDDDLEDESATEVSNEDGENDEKSSDDSENQEEDEESVSTDEDESSSEDESDKNSPYKDYSEAAIVAESLKKDGDLPENLDVNKDLSWYDLKNYIKKQALEEAKESGDSYVENIGEAQKYVEYLLEGGDPNTLAQALSHVKYSALDIEGEDNDKNRETVLKAYYKDKGLEDDEVDDLLVDLQDKGKDEARAKTAVDYFKKKEQKVLNDEKARRVSYQKAQEEQAEKQAGVVRQMISAGTLNGTELTKKEQKDLEDAIFKRTEKYTYLDQSGKRVNTKVSKIQKLQMEFQNSMEQQLAFAKLLLDGFDLSKIEDRGREDQNDRLLDILDARTTKKSKPRSRRKENGFDKLAARGVAEFDV